MKDAGASLFGGVAAQREKWPVSAFRWPSPEDVCALVCTQERVGIGQHPGTNMWRSEEDARHLPLLLLTSFLKTEFLT